MKYKDTPVFIVAKLHGENRPGASCFLTSKPGRWAISPWYAKQFVIRDGAEKEAKQHDNAVVLLAELTLTLQED